MFARRSISALRRLFTNRLHPTRAISRNSLALMQLEAREVPAYAGGVNIAVGT